MYFPGLEGVIVKESKICLIDVENSKIYYRGYDLEELAERSTFEETVYLLWHGSLPRRSELEEFKKALANHRVPPCHVKELALNAPKTAEPIDVLRTAVSAMAFGEDLRDKSPEAEFARGVRITGAMPYIVAAFDRSRRGLKPAEPLEAENHAEFFLWALKGERPTRREAKALDVMLVIYAEHSMNNSAFTAVTVASTLADVYAAVTAAIASLKGPLHGGANVDASLMLEEVGDVKNVERWVEEQLAKGRRIPGFGHRIYKKGPDPRLKVLRRLARDLAAEHGDYRWVELAEKLEEHVTAKLSHKGIYPNTDLYAAVIFRYLGFPVDVNLPVFAISRVAGWVAHVLEYRQANRLIRPTEKYVGPVGLKYVSLEERG